MNINYISSRGNIDQFAAAILLCRCENVHNKQGFYLATANNFNGYVVITSNQHDVDSLIVRGIVMDYVHLEAEADALNKFRQLYTNYVNEGCK